MEDRTSAEIAVARSAVAPVTAGVGIQDFPIEARQGHSDPVAESRHGREIQNHHGGGRASTIAAQVDDDRLGHIIAIEPFESLPRELIAVQARLGPVQTVVETYPLLSTAGGNNHCFTSACPLTRRR